MRARSSLAIALATLCFALAGPARAQLDLASVSFDLEIERRSGATNRLAVTILAQGTGIQSASITFPNSVLARPLTANPSGDWVLSSTFADEATLNAEFQDGNYLLDLNTAATTVTIPYVRPVVPSPAISSPIQGSAVRPRNAEFRFSPCSPICNAPGSSAAKLTSGTGVIAEDPNLDPTASSWVPSDASGPIEIPGNSDFTFEIVHTARGAPTTVNDPNDAFEFAHSFEHSDQVQFTTSFPFPEGEFSVLVDDRASPIYDPSGSVQTTVAGMALEWMFAVRPNGQIRGIAAMDVDGDGNPETPAVVKGWLYGKRGRLLQKTKIKVKSRPPGPEAKLKVIVRERIDATALGQNGDLLRTGEQKIRGKRNGEKISEVATIVDSIVGARLDWTIDFEMLVAADETIQIVDALLTLGSGEAVGLVGDGVFDTATGTSDIKLRSRGASKGARIRIEELRIDDLGEIAGGRIRYRAFGQRGVAILP
jgi:hypothetical protein